MTFVLRMTTDVHYTKTYTPPSLTSNSYLILDFPSNLYDISGGVHSSIGSLVIT